MKFSKLLITGFILSCLTILSCQTKDSNDLKKGDDLETFTDILNLKGIPDNKTDRSKFMFSDKGAWHGFALAVDSASGAEVPTNGSFVGPFIMLQENGVWMSDFLSELSIYDVEKETELDLSSAIVLKNHYYPDKLVQNFTLEKEALKIDCKLGFASKRSSIISLTIENIGQNPRNMSIGWKGESTFVDVDLELAKQGIKIKFKDYDHLAFMSMYSKKPSLYEVKENQYKIHCKYLPLLPKQKAVAYLFHSFCFDSGELENELENIENYRNDPDMFFEENSKRWEREIHSVLSQINPVFRNDTIDRIAVKCIETLRNNHRSAAGFLKHAGLFPSYNYEWFHGFWAWDSWKHSVALVEFDPNLAKDQIRAMFDFQDSMGMVADCVYRDTLIENHNYRNTKPPLAAWAVQKIYDETRDRDFLLEMLPMIEKSHQWWYENRDNDQNGLCEYGSTDGSLVAAKWESGMDNAVRFDAAKIVKNKENAWSLNMESVDLNAYLYAEKKYLASLNKELANDEKSKEYEIQADNLKSKIRKFFYDERSSWYFDIDLQTKEEIKIMGPEGWIALWTGLASEEQASKMKDIMMDEKYFRTFIPFPTLSADHPDFKADRGYWRGPVWLDQAYFAISGLRKYGYEEEADVLTLQLLNNLEGLMSDGPIRENYHPHSGKGLEAKHFSWSAAHILMLLMER